MTGYYGSRRVLAAIRRPGFTRPPGCRNRELRTLLAIACRARRRNVAIVPVAIIASDVFASERATAKSIKRLLDAGLLIRRLPAALGRPPVYSVSLWTMPTDDRVLEVVAADEQARADAQGRRWLTM